jgi:hypothetical protein
MTTAYKDFIYIYDYIYIHTYILYKHNIHTYLCVCAMLSVKFRALLMLGKYSELYPQLLHFIKY